jgi:hypothetical protein
MQETSSSSSPAVYLLLCRHHSALEVYAIPSLLLVASFPSLEQGSAILHASSSEEQSSVRPGDPEACEVVEIRMDSWAPLRQEKQPLGAMPAPETLQAERPLLVARTRDERVYVYRMQVCQASATGTETALCLARQPLDWTKCALLSACIACLSGLLSPSGLHACVVSASS